MAKTKPDKPIPNHPDLAALRDERLKACGEEIARVLELYGCQFSPVPYVTEDGRLSARVAIMLKPA